MHVLGSPLSILIENTCITCIYTHLCVNHCIIPIFSTLYTILKICTRKRVFGIWHLCSTSEQNNLYPILIILTLILCSFYSFFYIEICRNYKLYLYSDIFIFFVLIIYIIYGTQYFLNKWWYSHEGKCFKGKCSDFTALNIFHTHSVIHLFFLYLWIIWHSSIKADKFCFWKKKDCFTSY